MEGLYFSRTISAIALPDLQPQTPAIAAVRNDIEQGNGVRKRFPNRNQLRFWHGRLRAKSECVSGFAGGDGEIHDALHPIVSVDRHLAMGESPNHLIRQFGNCSRRLPA